MNLIGVDIGGTFTDFVLLDSEKRSIRTAKMLTDPAEPDRVVPQGIARLLEENDNSSSAVSGLPVAALPGTRR